MRLKAINEEVRPLVDQCIFDIINKSIAAEFKIGSEALKMIFDSTLDYYKYNNQDPTLKYPLGHNRALNWYEPEEGENIDVVKPYITSTSYCGWTRALLVEKANKKYVLKYENTETPTICRELPFCDKLGARTPHHEWRMNLNVGDTLDAFCRIWYAATVAEVAVENGAKRARITFRRFS